MLTIFQSLSAKELEHYQHVRRTFEGFDTSKNSVSSNYDIAPTRIPAPVGASVQSVYNQGAKLKLKYRAATSKSKAKGTGKGKATAWDSNDDTENKDDDEDEDDAYLTSQDFEDERIQAKHGMNGTVP